MSTSISLRITFALTLLSGGILHAQSAQAAGRALFEEKGCTHCHSLAGTGGHKGPALDGVGKRLKQDAIEHQILAGGLTMPPFAEALTAPEVHDLVEFLHKCRKDIATPHH